MEERGQKAVLEIAEGRFEKRLSQVEAKLEGKIGEVKIEIAHVESRLIKWMFLFWAGQIGAITGILLVFFHR